MKDKKIDEAMTECYTILYEKATPSADFKKLIDEAETNSFGQKVIDFNSYEIEEDVLDSVIESIIKKYKMKGHYPQMFKNSIYLGCSPRTKFKNK